MKLYLIELLTGDGKAHQPRRLARHNYSEQDQRKMVKLLKEYQSIGLKSRLLTFREEKP